jgi:hypothetical protein
LVKNGLKMGKNCISKLDRFFLKNTKANKTTATQPLPLPLPLSHCHFYTTSYQTWPILNQFRSFLAHSNPHCHYQLPQPPLPLPLCH